MTRVDPDVIGRRRLRFSPDIARLRGQNATTRIAGLVVIVLIVGLFLTPHALTVANLRAVLVSSSVTGIVAVAMTPMTISGNFVSLASSQTVMVAAVTFAALIGRGDNVVLALVVVVAVVVASGLVQGALVAAGLSPVITTLAAGAAMIGIVSWRTNAGTVTFNGRSIDWLGSARPLGIPVQVYYFIGITVLLEMWMSRTVGGRRVLLSGSNARTAALSGIAVKRVALISFAIFSVGCALAGLLAVSQAGSASSTFLSSLTIDAITAVLIGGTSVQGGRGSVLWSAGGAILIALIQNEMLLRGYSFGVSATVEGAIVVMIVLALNLNERRRGTGT
ncbi:ABC transporter permease [Jatrophihabitans sp. DSM 45814]